MLIFTLGITGCGKETKNAEKDISKSGQEEVEKEGIKYDVTHFGITRHEWEVNKTGYHYNWIEFD